MFRQIFGKKVRNICINIYWLFACRYFRMSPERFQHLNSLTAPYLTKACRNRVPISPEQRLAITLRYLATGDSQKSESFNFVVGRSTVSKIVRECCSALWQALAKTYIPTPTSDRAWKEIANEFMNEWNLPHVIGALDGKHIHIQCPKFGGSDFYNYKEFHSMNLMAICDAQYRFLWTDIGSYGRDNDASVFNRSDMFSMLDQNRLNIPASSCVNNINLPYVIVADEIFPLKTWLLKPYPGRNLSESKTIFNYKLSRARRTIGNAFGILTTKWRIFRRPIIASTDLVDLIVQACVCLHNYLLLTDNAKYLPTGFVDSYSDSGEIIEGQWRKEAQPGALARLAYQGALNQGNDAKNVRDRFCDYVNSIDGSLPWQIDHVRHDGRQERPC